MSKKTLRVLWLLTAAMALILVVATLRLADRARGQAVLGSTVYLDGRARTIQLRDAPGESSGVVAALVRGSAVTVLASVTHKGQTWYRVQKADMTPGWIPGGVVRLDPP